jgi:hypothetical protein
LLRSVITTTIIDQRQQGPHSSLTARRFLPNNILQISKLSCKRNFHPYSIPILPLNCCINQPQPSILAAYFTSCNRSPNPSHFSSEIRATERIQPQIKQVNYPLSLLEKSGNLHQIFKYLLSCKKILFHNPKLNQPPHAPICFTSQSPYSPSFS